MGIRDPDSLTNGVLTPRSSRTKKPPASHEGVWRDAEGLGRKNPEPELWGPGQLHTVQVYSTKRTCGELMISVKMSVIRCSYSAGLPVPRGLSPLSSAVAPMRASRSMKS